MKKVHLKLIVRRANKYSLPAVLTTLSIVGAMALVVSTRWGVGLSPDSIIYIVSARNLLSGHGLSTSFDPGTFVPMTHYPPLYSTLLAGIGIFGMDPVEGARWLNVFFFAANAILVGMVLHVFTRSSWLSLFGSLLMLGSFPIVQIHSMAWSEPVFLFFTLLGIFLLVIYIEEGKPWLLVSASGAVALGFLTRYAGIALVIAGMAGVYLLHQKSWQTKLIDAMKLGTISSLPMSLWMVRNTVFPGGATDRQLGFYPPSMDYLKSAGDLFLAWIIPADVSFSTKLTIFLLVVVLIFFICFTWMRAKRWELNRLFPQRIRTLVLLLGIFILSYALVLVASFSFYDPQIPIDNRILSPVFVAWLVLILSATSGILATAVPTRSIRMLLAMLGVIFFLSQLPRTATWLKLSYDVGLGYARLDWKGSRLIQWVNHMDARIPVFTNGPDVLYLLTGRPAYMVPGKVRPGTELSNEHYWSEIEDMKRRIKEEKGVLVYLKKITWRRYLPTEEELQERLPLRLILRDEEGSVYRIEDTKS